MKFNSLLVMLINTQLFQLNIKTLYMWAKKYKGHLLHNLIKYSRLKIKKKNILSKETYCGLFK